MNDRLLEDYRDVITSMRLNNDTITTLLLSGKGDTANKDSLLWHNLIPQKYVDGVVTDAETHILYDLDEDVLYPRNSSNGVYTVVTAYFWIRTHKNAPLYNGRLKNDIITEELTELFQRTKSLGISPAKKIYNRHDVPELKEYSGRLLVFNVTDWGDDIRRKYEKYSKR